MDVNDDEDSLDHDKDGLWPFHSFVEQLLLDMFDPGMPLICLSLLINRV